VRSIFNKISAITLRKHPAKESIRDETGCHQYNTEKQSATIIPCLNIGYAQSIGKQREHNEDSLFILNTNIISNNDVIPFGLFIVADGMGGHQYGEIASNVAVRTLATSLVEGVYLPLLSSAILPDQKVVEEKIHQAVNEANREIIHFAPGGGTTLTALLIFGTCMTIAHVGDSRTYLIDTRGNAKLLTRDHSLVNRLLELGQISDDEAAVHPQRNILYRALGQGEPFEPDLSTTTLPDSGYLLLCSDGLWGVIPETELINYTISSHDLQTTCNKLVDAANDAGGADNISIIMIQLGKE
jgi:serine/threonine protein phosphatase PrpC